MTTFCYIIEPGGKLRLRSGRPPIQTPAGESGPLFIPTGWRLCSTYTPIPPVHFLFWTPGTRMHELHQSVTFRSKHCS